MRLFSLLCGIFLLAATLSVATGAGADEVDSLRADAGSLGQANGALDAAAQGALLELYALETRLGRAERQTAALRGRLADLEQQQDTAQRHLQIARSAERVAQRELGDRLTALYVEGETDPFEVILGASSLDDVISAVDGLARLAEEDNRIVAQASKTRASLRSALRDLSRHERELRNAVAEGEAASSSLAAARDEKAAYLASLERERRLNEGQISALTVQAAEAEARSAELEAQAETAATPTPSPAAETPASLQVASAPTAGVRALTVDAVAYSLPGYTASGLPVGKGVVAVDPTVIPLGTRMFVPGYGPAIAADVGTAIKGLIIDLWFPTYEQAAAWGRKTVTITIYR